MKRTLQFGAASWGFRETPLERQLEITQALGLDELELGIAGHENDVLQLGATAETLMQVQALFAGHGIPLLHASTGNDFTQADEAACLASLEAVKRVSEIAAKLGARHLRIFAGFSPEEEVQGARWELMVRCLNEAVRYAAPLGLTLAVETHGGVKSVPGGVVHFDSTTTRPELIARLLCEVDKRATILFDPANLGAVGMSEGTILALYRTLRPRISALHLKDFKVVGSNALQPCACGEGKLDWEILMHEFREFSGVGFMEYENTEDIEAGLKRTLAAIGT
jgi:sugar phosphate isomerase/epimerase